MKQLATLDSQANLDAVFSALADPTRRSILKQLADGPASVAELTEPYEMSQPAISKHLKVLERGGLITRDVDQQKRPARLEADNLAVAVEWLEEFRAFWETSFDQLDVVLAQMQKTEE